MAVSLSEIEEKIGTGSDRKGDYTITRKECVEFAPGGKFYNEKNKNYGRYQYFVNREGKEAEMINACIAMDMAESLTREEFKKFFN